MSRNFDDYNRRVLSKYGSWENNINSNVLYFYKFQDCIDKGILDFLIKLNNYGCHTVFSCSGHSENSMAYVVFASYVTKSKVLDAMKKLFNADEGMFTFENIKVNNGVPLLRIVISSDKKALFGITTSPNNFKSEG